MTLFELCVEEIVKLLQENYWPIGIHDFDEHNPFVALPCDITEKLISAVLHSPGSLSVNFLYPLLIGGRIKNFKFEYVIVTHEELICILTTLSIQGFQLNSLILDDIQFLAPKYSDLNQLSQSVASAIESLLALSPNLKKIRIAIPFDLKAIQKIEALKQLELKFTPKNGLYDMILKIDESLYIPNDSLTHLSITEKPRYVIPTEEIAFILQYCTELTYFENNIAGGLELLHEFELLDGSLETKYKLQNIVLGDIFSDTESAVASASAVHIASLTCPDVKTLEILLNDHQAVTALRYFKNLEVLLLQWEMVASPGDFRLSVQLALNDIGSKLTKLTINEFCNIDFEAIGRTCPHLEFLKIEYYGTANTTESTCFENLETLHLDCMNEEGVTKQTMLQLLSSCKNLSSLSLENILSLDDDTLEQILLSNRLTKLNDAHLIKCALKESGLQAFVKTCESLRFFTFCSSDLSFDNAINIVHEINPFIVLMG